MKRTNLLALATLVSASIWLAGCDPKPASQPADGAKPEAKAPTAPALKVIEKPTKEQIAAAKPYPLETCAVSGEKLGSMGEPPVILVGDQQVKLCCGGCIDDWKKDPAGLLAKLQKK